MGADGQQEGVQPTQESQFKPVGMPDTLGAFQKVETPLTNPTANPPGGQPNSMFDEFGQIKDGMLPTQPTEQAPTIQDIVNQVQDPAPASVMPDNVANIFQNHADRAAETAQRMAEITPLKLSGEVDIKNIIKISRDELMNQMNQLLDERDQKLEAEILSAYSQNAQPRSDTFTENLSVTNNSHPVVESTPSTQPPGVDALGLPKSESPLNPNNQGPTGTFNQ